MFISFSSIFPLTDLEIGHILTAHMDIFSAYCICKIDISRVGVYEDMNLKIFVLLLFLLLLSSENLSAAVEPLYVGSGVGGQIVNLDAGAARPGSHYSFAKSGFAAPGVPQSKVVSTNILLHQAENLRDQAKAIRDDTERLHNLTESLAEHAERNLEEVKALTEEMRSAVQSSSMNVVRAEKSAAQSEEYFGRILTIYNDTVNQSQNIKILSDETRSNKEASDINLAKTEGYLGEARSLYNNTLNLSGEVRIREAETKKLWMDAVNRSEKFTLNVAAEKIP